jgi:N-acetylglucosaminyldiphosphoundecaprenol N-acetyl-beta-D-mannosaminyltransferase
VITNLSALYLPVQLGVGAAFSFLTGKVRQAPLWMQKTYLEWLYRLPQEPKKTIYRMSLVPEFLLRLLRAMILKSK